MNSLLRVGMSVLLVVMVRSFGLGIPRTCSVYIFVPSIPRCVLLVIPAGNVILLFI